MSLSAVKTTEKPRLSFRAQTAAALAAIAAAVAVPQLFHLIGAVSGLGTLPGETFLPMHLPVILAGLIAGPYAGAAAGLISPLCSFLLTGMPKTVMLPFMMIELAVYGLTAGLLRQTKIPAFPKLLIVQLAGRAVRAAAILLGVFVFGSRIGVPVIWTSIAAGLPGIVLQWALLPLLSGRIDERFAGRRK